jgi:hypothetical protein
MWGHLVGVVRSPRLWAGWPRLQSPPSDPALSPEVVVIRVELSSGGPLARLDAVRMDLVLGPVTHAGLAERRS